MAAAVRDAVTITWRNLKGMSRTPEVIVFSTVQPVLFVLTFRYVFGGAINVPGQLPYVDFLMPGVFVQTVAFGGMNTAIGLAEDAYVVASEPYGLVEETGAYLRLDGESTGGQVVVLSREAAGTLAGIDRRALRSNRRAPRRPRG